MTDYEMHEPEYSGTTTEEWDAPQMEDFDTADLDDDTESNVKDLLEDLSQEEFDEDMGT